jgi:hypothetical protein
MIKNWLIFQQISKNSKIKTQFIFSKSFPILFLVKNATKVVGEKK